MNFSRLNSFSLRAKFSIFAGLLLVFGLFGVVLLSQQKQETRSHASGSCPTSGGDSYDNDCTVNGGFQGNLYGSGVTITGGLIGNVGNMYMPQQGNRSLIMQSMIGNLDGSNSEVCGDLWGNLEGSNNIIHGGLHGNNTGRGNVINSTAQCGIIRIVTPTPTSIPPTPTPTRVPTPTPTTPVPTPTPTQVPTPTPTRVPTPTPTRTPTPTPTNIPPTPTIPVGATAFSVSILLHGIGKGGDSANPNGGGGNPNPIHTQRQINIQVLDGQNQVVLSKDGFVNFNSTAGNFTGVIDMGNTLTSSVYIIKVKSNQFLRNYFPGFRSIIPGALNVMRPTVLISGDINNDNNTNILDYSILLGCYSDLLPAVSCTRANMLQSDLDDDGNVNQFDYNLFLRELTNVGGV